MLTLTVDAYGSTPSEWKTLKWSALSAKTRKRVGEMFSLAAPCGAVKAKGVSRKMRSTGRMMLSKDQVSHKVGGSCFICGAEATKVVKGKKSLVGQIVGEKKRKVMKLCTAHFSQLFRLPPTRHPKQPKRKVGVVLNEERRFVLKRHLKPAFVFNGKRVICDMVNEQGNTWYFALYENHDAQNNVLSVTRILPGMKAVVHVVRPNIRKAFTATLLAMLRKQKEICPGGNYLIVEEAASRFLDHIMLAD